MDIVHQDEAATVARVRNLMVALFSDSPEPIHVRAMGRAFNSAIADHAGGVGTVVMLDGARMPRFSDEFRHSAVELTRATEHGGLATAFVVLPTGFIASLSRAFISGVFLAARSKEPMKTFASIADAAVWLAPKISRGEQWSATELARVVRSVLNAKQGAGAAVGSSASR